MIPGVAGGEASSGWNIVQCPLCLAGIPDIFSSAAELCSYYGTGKISDRKSTRLNSTH